MKKRKIDSTAGCVSPQSKRKRPDVTVRKQQGKYYGHHVVKCTLAPFSRYKVVTDEVRDCVYWMSRLVVHTSHVVTTMVVQNGGTLPLVNGKLYGMYNKVMRTLGNVLQGIDRKGTDPHILQACERYVRETGLEPGTWPNGCLDGWRRKVLDEMARQAATGHKTHIETNLANYVARYLKFLVRTAPEAEPVRQLPVGGYKKVFSAISDAFYKHEQIACVIGRRPSTLKMYPADHAIWPIAQGLLDQLVALVPHDSTLSQMSEAMFQIMSAVEPFAAELQRRFLAGGPVQEGRRWGKTSWTFDMCPQACWRPKHIQISSTAVKQLLKDLSKKHSHLKTVLDGLRANDDGAEEDDEALDNLWGALFKMKRVLRAKHLRDRTRLRFGHFIATDGVSVSAVIMQRKSPRACELIDVNAAISRVKAELEAAPGTDALKQTLKDLDTQAKEIRKEIKMCGDPTIITDRIKALAGLSEDEDGIVTAATKIVGLDPGKKSAATWVFHDPVKQATHQKWHQEDGQKTLIEDRYESGSLPGNEWRFMSGQKQHTRKMNKRMDRLCPDARRLPSTKTVVASRLLAAYAQQCALWPQIEAAFFDDTLWMQKQRMKRFVREQRAMEDVVARITGTRDKAEQRKVIVAYGDGDKQGTLRGTSPLMSTKLFKKVSQSACVVVTNEFKTTLLCSCCRKGMTQWQNQFRMKCCTNSNCIRTVWDRDINASINILYLFLAACLSESGKYRPEEFSRCRGCDE